jgi:hypothetical protein
VKSKKKEINRIRRRREREFVVGDKRKSKKRKMSQMQKKRGEKE